MDDPGAGGRGAGVSRARGASGMCVSGRGRARGWCVVCGAHMCRPGGAWAWGWQGVRARIRLWVWARRAAGSRGGVLWECACGKTWGISD